MDRTPNLCLFPHRVCNTVTLVQNCFPVATGKVMHFNTTYDVMWSTSSNKEGKKSTEMVLLKENKYQVLWIQVTEMVLETILSKKIVCQL